MNKFRLLPMAYKVPCDLAAAYLLTLAVWLNLKDRLWIHAALN